MKLSDAIAGYFLDRGLELADTTIANYRHFFGLLLAFHGDTEIESITTRDINRFLIHLSKERNMSDRTVYDTRARLSSLWKWATVELKIANVVTGAVKPTYRKPEIVAYTKSELQALLQAAEHAEPWQTASGKLVKERRATAKRDVAIILTLTDTGMRASELCDLTIADYDEKRARLHILHGKGDKGRFVVMGKRTQKAIWRYLASRAAPGADEPLFVSSSGSKLDRHNLYHTIRRMGNRVGIDGATVHRFRHTFAITFLRNGGNVFELQELLGHEDIKTMSMYVKLSELDLDAAQRYSPADNWRL